MYSSRLALVTFLAFFRLPYQGLSAYVPRGIDNLTVNTTEGVVHGYIDRATPQVRQFLGIPYAQPPLKELRFSPPKPALPFGEFNATSFPSDCMQQPPSSNSNGPQFNSPGPFSEDCLGLSIWAPIKGNLLADLPVIVFIHGGAFIAGSQSVPLQNAAQWVQRTQQHIVVSLNYRLNIFGFPRAAGLSDQNLGLLDQRLAVQWMERNIAAFGGDPSRIVLWGQSAGAISIAYYGYAFAKSPIVSGLIMNSGSEYLLPVIAENQTYKGFASVAERVGCGNSSSEKVLACMRHIPADKILGGNFTSFFGPVIDNQIVFANYTQLATMGKIANLPAIIGSTAQEAAAPPTNDTTNSQELGQLIQECGVLRATSNRLAANVETFQYKYSGNFSNISPYPWMGAYHSSDIPLIFGTHSLLPMNSTELEWATSIAMQDAWLAFAKGGAQSLAKDARWAKYTTLNPSVKNFGNMTAAQDTLSTISEKQCALIGGITIPS